MRKLSSIFLVFALITASLPTAALAAALPHAQNGLSPDSFLNADGTLNIPEDFNGSFDLEGWSVSLDELRGPVFQPAAAPADTWEPLDDNGLSSSALALAVVGTDLYVGGSFFQSFGGSVGLNNIARYDTTGGSWHALANTGLNSTVRALAVVGTDLYVGGDFTQSATGATTGLNRIAKYDTTSGTWGALADDGLNIFVRALAVVGADLYVGGSFTQSFGGAATGLNNIARYDTGSGTWHALADNGLNSNVFALTVMGTDLYVGGAFVRSFGSATLGLNRITRYDTTGGSWHALADTGLNNAVFALGVVGTDLYVGGQFTQSATGATTGLNRIARYDTTSGSWGALADNGLNNAVVALGVVGTDLYVGGQFTQSSGGATTGLNRIARYDTTGGWEALADNGLSSTVRALSVGTDLFVGGDFAQSFGAATTGLNRIAAYGLPAVPQPTYSAIPADGSTLAFSGAAGDNPSLDIEVTNTGDPGSDLDVTLTSISGGYSIVSGLPIDDMQTTDPAGTIVVQCDSVPQADGALVLTTNDSSNTSVTYDLTCTTDPGAGVGSDRGEGAQQTCSQEVNSSGTTVLACGRIRVSIPASAIPAGESGCRIVIKKVGDSGVYGFTLDDVVWDVKVICNGGEVNIFFAPITVCIRPKDGNTIDKQLFHRHSGGAFLPLPVAGGPAGYICGQTYTLSLFTLGSLSLPNTSFAPSGVTQLREQPVALEYNQYDALMLEIPRLDVMMPIWGVPQNQNGWDVSWLGENAGYLHGTAFPTWIGNSVLTAHVWNADNSAGPFYHLKDLQHGDLFYVHAYSQTFVYEIRSNRLVSERNLSVMKDSDHSLITLITCESFNEGSGEYLYRRAVQAVLVDVQ